jgi:hypothetical protein
MTWHHASGDPSRSPVCEVPSHRPGRSRTALDLGLVTMAVGIGCIAIWRFNCSSRITTWADHAVADVPLVAANH